MNIYLDLETIPDQRPGAKERIAAEAKPPGTMKKEDTIAKWREENAEENWRRTALDGAQGQIAVIGFKLGDSRADAFMLNARLDNEAEIIQAFYRELEGLYEHPTRWVGHNLLDFDLRFLYHRSVILGIQPSFPLPVHVSPWDDRVFDTMKMWAGNRGSVSLDAMASALGIEGKDGMDGSMVWDMIQAGNMRNVAHYCMRDVDIVWEAYHRLNFMPMANLVPF